MSKSFYTRIFILIVFLSASISIIAQTSLKDETRFPWGTATGGFIQDWLVVGGFPNQGDKGYNTDFLQEHGGELGIKPEPGMIHKLPNGATLEWKSYHSPYNYINFFDVLQEGEFNSKVIYAFTNVKRENDGKVILSFAQNNSNKLWVNGKLVYESRDDHQAALEDNQLEADMVKGENSILIKSVHDGWTWGFRFRIIEPDKFSLIDDFKLSPSIVLPSEKDKLIIKTDRTLNPEIQKFGVNVKVVAAGGKVVAEKNAKRGEQVIFDTNKWPDGVYDIYFKTNDTHGRIMTAYLFWFKGDAIKKAKELLSSVPENPKTPEDYHHKMLGEMLTERFHFDPNKIDSSIIRNLYSPLMEYEELLLDKAGKVGSIHAEGFVRLTYIDPVDNTPQFCRAYLPLNYNPKQKWALVVMLHGYNGDNPIYVNWWSIDQRHNDVVDKYPIIYMEPHGRGNTSYLGIGDNDILKCIELAKQEFNIDEDRVYLKGESMGGGGTWNVGTRHPELFAAIAPVYGGWDYHVGLNEDEIAKLSGRALFNVEASSSLSHADALLNTPVFVTHGDIDKSVDVNNSRYLVKTLQRWGYDIRYHEYPGFGHEGIEYYDQLIPWFLEHKRNVNPVKVRVRSADLKYASAHWVKITQLDNPNSFVTAEAEVLINNTIKLSTENVLEIELTPSDKLIDPEKPVKVIWNVNDIRNARVTDGKITLRDKSYKPALLHKTPQIAGMISDITTTPFAVVIGTISKDSLMTKMINTKAGQFINYWKNWQKYEPRVFKDVDLSQDDLKKYSLILYGGADDNLITKMLGDKIPLKISPDEIEIAGRKFQANDAFVQMIYPNPYNSRRYVSVIGATSSSGMFLYNNNSSNYDFLIQDGCIPNTRLGRPIEKLYIAFGSFDYNWQINDKLLGVGDKELRKNSPIRKVLPDFTTTVENIPAIDSVVCKTFVGKYEAPGGFSLSVMFNNGKLNVKTPDGAIIQLYPSSETEYFIDAMDVQITFNKNENGTVDKMIVHQGGQDTEIKKVE
ncbi:prolyl oligopeptidase family serine peptidase [bacterium BMS3Abin03]|nr:prolyl oligopeptidase family serine peptidase [bacterium BMS3Abin03]